MSKKQDYVVYTYRYIWKEKENKDGLFNVKYITGSTIEHKNFMSRLLENEQIVCASRIYVGEVNVSLTEQHEIVKKEQK